MHPTVQNKTKENEHLGGCQVNSTQRVLVCFTKQHIADELLMGQLQANFSYFYNTFLKYFQKLDSENKLVSVELCLH